MQSQNSIPHNYPQPQKSGNSFRRFQYDHGFMTLPNSLFTDTSISLEAAGLMGFLMQLPETYTNDKGETVPWVVYNCYIQRQRKIGEKLLNRIINELIDAGYMKRERARAQKGRFGSYDYLFAPLKLFLPDALKQPGSSSLAKAVLYNTNPISLLKEATTIVAETVDESSQEVAFVAASSGEEEHTESKKHAVLGSPMNIQASLNKDTFPATVTWQQKLGQIPRLQKLDIPMHEKEWLLNHFNLPDIEESIAWATLPTTQIKKNVESALKWFLSLSPEKRPKGPRQIEESTSLRRAACENMEKSLYSPIFQINAAPNMVIIETQSGNGPSLEIPYDKENFENLVEDAIRQRGFKMRAQCQPSSLPSMNTEHCRNQDADTKQSQDGERSTARSSSSVQHGKPTTHVSLNSKDYRDLLATGCMNLRPSGSMP